MPVYNGSAFIATAIDSLLAQSYPAWELVVIDDGSTDDTPGVVGRYADERIRYFRQENRGQAAALNAGLDRAGGEFVTTLDADDWLTPDSLACRMDGFEAHRDADVVYGDGVYRDEQGRPLQRFTELMPAGVHGDVFDTLVVSPFYGTGAAVLIRRATLQRAGLRYDDAIAWCQDWDFYLRLAVSSSWQFADHVVINYRVHEAGMTLTMPSGRRLESLIRLRRKVLEMPRFAEVSPEQREKFFYDFIVRDLQDRVDTQREIFGVAAFRALPRERQATLLRVAANGYLAAGTHPAAVRAWLGSALAVRPMDVKTLLAWGLARTSPALARKVVGRWRSSQDQGNSLSPFDAVGREPETTSGPGAARR
jgi:glycosyltransferase involved in cell wall biosynthesis